MDGSPFPAATMRLPVWVLLLTVATRVASYPSLLDCDRELEPGGRSIMGATPEHSARDVIVQDFRGRQVTEYTPGESLVVSLSNTLGQAQFRASDAFGAKGALFFGMESCIDRSPITKATLSTAGRHRRPKPTLL